MKIKTMQQGTQEWFAAKKGKIGGTRFGKVISNRKNRLIYELLNEKMSDYIFPDDFVSDDMQFGIDNEPVAAQLYAQQSGIKFCEVGLIESDFSDIHLASPDRLSDDNSIVLEIKCTRNGDIHLQRYFEGVESTNLPQIINYFLVSDEVKEVHWVSYCPDRVERPLITIIFKRNDFPEIDKYREMIQAIEDKLQRMYNDWIF